ncbi:NAD(P)H-dependent oxidoreductase subunit E [Candidatus Desantisbacteria bacterium CG2_30_40_21]|uniref:NADH-quinone oxidoreductase subunit NuoE n=5 Tax=unclassified Candidatus Desantisiibacteriota TaxID=3106372 RepID=A0A2M7JEX1_9BACT|nr:MAG: NAD(P)H-dependent oxidoreductase subunit E [Candidatus Desantisbacteria bacterium CG2_30_40_21]PIP40779.1 MAG: NADH-quinone oxidoreductase subunit NuoE [Candidatus Desantisbacteria bacterium CG23_combo_of_CG06-09_8_20_14_all_40_23]PIX17942.1 MAG: NADH-quinone oxidoreductase subunit NuoE [Candidatus Desantisbacteria bacterium CG_4_8_14_3_um_filter_40_12]PIY19134.1 MAG: NADH-quinone oxidoreductase subunit NuoE [Candidatus Desantisbacteria bacterium CG_4_10_14_3_um_filter_40_18]PJB29615.1 
MCACIEKQQKLGLILSEYQGKSGGLIPVLQQAQGLYGYLSDEIMTQIAVGLGLKPSEVYGVATFYTQFRFSPVGEHIIRACHGTACHVSGAENITMIMADKLGVTPGGTTADMRFTLDKVACLGCCSLAPVVMIDEDVYGRLNEAKVVEILGNY